MRTNIEIDMELITKLRLLSGLKTKKEIVHFALEELLEKLERKSLQDLKGKIKFDPKYDYKKMRS